MSDHAIEMILVRRLAGYPFIPVVVSRAGRSSKIEPTERILGGRRPGAPIPRRPTGSSS